MLKPREEPLPGLTVEETCPRCGSRFRASAELDFLGFREATCPYCNQVIAHPLKWSYRITYWVFLSLWGLGLVQLILEGKLLETGTLGSVSLLFLLGRVILKDLKILRRRRSRA